MGGAKWIGRIWGILVGVLLLGIPCPSAAEESEQLVGAEIRSLQPVGYGKYVVVMQPSNVHGVVSSFFLFHNSGVWPAAWNEIDLEFVPGHVPASNVNPETPRIRIEGNCLFESTDCQVTDISHQSTPVGDQLISFNTFAYNTAQQTRASDHQVFYKTPVDTTKPQKYVFYFTPKGIFWSAGGEDETPVFDQNGRFLQNPDSPLDPNYIHTTDFPNLQDRFMYIHMNIWDGSVIKWGGPNPPKSSAVSTYYKVQYFPLLGGHCRSRCRFSPRAHIDADFVEGIFRIRGREVSFNQMWTITDDNKEPLGFLSGYNTFCEKGHPLRLFLKPPGEVPESNQCEYFK